MHMYCMAFQTTLQFMLVSDGHSESDYKQSYDQGSHGSTTFPSRGYNAHSVRPYEYSNMAMYTGNVHT